MKLFYSAGMQIAETICGLFSKNRFIYKVHRNAANSDVRQETVLRSGTKKDVTMLKMQALFDLFVQYDR